MRNSMGRGALPTYALTPALNASSTAFSVASGSRQSPSDTRRNPIRRVIRSYSSAASPSTSASVPEVTRRLNSICHSLSCACAYPTAKNRSRRLLA